MKLLHIDPITKSVKELELKVEANTFYTFFSSILIDEFPIDANHTLYSNANALSENKTPYFVADQIVLGEALVLGNNGYEEVDATLTPAQLESMIRFDVSDFYKKALFLLAKTDENLYKAFYVEHNGSPLCST